MFTLNVRKLFRNNFGSRQSPTLRRRKPHPTFQPRVEALEERCCPSGGAPYATQSTAVFWDPKSGNDANVLANWDAGKLGGLPPTALPGNVLNETQNIYFDGSTQRANQNCTWNYKPTYALGAVTFQNAWTQTVAFSDQIGFSVSAAAVKVTGDSTPTITPNGKSGASAVPAITLKNGSYVGVDSGSTLFLQGYSGGNAIFFASDGAANEVLNNQGTVSYLGVGSATTTANMDYLKIPVQNAGVFKVNGNIGTNKTGAVLQVSGSDAVFTKGVSFYQTGSDRETDISGNGTLWCVNNYTMYAGLLQTLDANTNILEVGTGGSSPVDGSATLLSGTVNIYANANANAYGTLQIVGTTGANAPTLNLGDVTLNFNVSMTTDVHKNDCNKLIVGNTGGTGKVVFGNNSTTTTVAINYQGAKTTGHQWQIIFFGSVAGTSSVTLSPATGFTPNWSKPKILEIDN